MKLLRIGGLLLSCIGSFLNAAPVANPITVTGCVGQLLSGQLTATGGTAPYFFAKVIGSDQNGLGVVQGNGAFTFAPSNPSNTSGQFQFTATDSTLSTSNPATATLQITVPNANNQTLSTPENTPLNGNLSPLVSGGQTPFTFQAVCPAVNGNVSVTSNTGAFTFTPTTNFQGVASFRYVATDANGCITNVGKITINVGSGTCTLQAINGTGVVCQGSGVTGTLGATGGVGALTFALVNGSVSNGTAMVNSNGTFTFTGAIGSATSGGFQFTVTDTVPCTATGTETITLNKLPTASNQNLSTPKNTALNGSVATSVSGGTSPYTFAVISNVSHGVLSLNTSTGAFTYTPTTNFVGSDSFTYQATDSSSTHCKSNIATVNITVTQTSCTLAAINGTGVVCQGSGVTGTLGATGGVGTLTFALTGPVNNGTAVVNSNGTFTFTGATGSATSGGFNFSVTDSNACVATGSETITLNQLPTASNSSFTTAENTELNSSVASSVSGGTSPYTFTLVTNVQHGTLTLNSDGSFTYNPNPSYVGPDSFQFKATDSSSTHCMSNVATASITVTGTICTLVAVPASFSTCINRNVAGQLTATGGHGTVTFSLVPNSDQHGTAVVNSDGSFTFSPDHDFAGNASFQFNVIDQLLCQSSATVTIHVENPTAIGADYVTTVGQPVSGNLVPTVSDYTAPLTFTLVGAPINGTVVLNPNGSFIFTPTTSVPATGHFSYMATDAIGCVTNVATATIDITVCTPVTNPFVNAFFQEVWGNS